MAGAMVVWNVTPTLALYAIPSFKTYKIIKKLQGVPPATVAEWTLQGDGNKDFYDGKFFFASSSHLTWLITAISLTR